MSNINYDVTYPVNYNPAYKHYLARYYVNLRPYKTTMGSTYHWGKGYDWTANYGAAVSFDDGSEISISDSTDYYAPYTDENPPSKSCPLNVQTLGPFNRVYIRNTHPDLLTFTTGNTFFSISYFNKALFEIQFNAVGFAANRNASFRCSTIPQNCIEQYEWTSAVVYYKKSTESAYKSVNATVSGSWSDVNVATNVGFEDGFIYDVYIEATADDGTKARTPVAQFSTVDAQAVATCLSPVGAFTSGDVTFSWAHLTEYGTPQYAYDLRYSKDNGGSWVNAVTHAITSASTYTTKLDAAGSYIWQVRTYNTNDISGEWAQASFVNNVPATPPTNVSVTTDGRPTVSWIAASQSAYQVQVLFGDVIEYDSGAIYSASNKHRINKYFYKDRVYTVKVRVYNALGDVSEWSAAGYQQPIVPDVTFEVEQDANGGVDIIITENSEFDKYFILRNRKPIAEVSGAVYYDKFAIGDVNYSVVGVTNSDNSDIKSAGLKAVYPRATIITLSGELFAVNKRFNETYSVKTTAKRSYNKAQYLGDSKPNHYADEMVDKSFSITCFDEKERLESLLGQIVFYADNFGNGGYCFITDYSKENDYLQLSDGTYANEVTLVLEVTDYDDSIEYQI